MWHLCPLNNHISWQTSLWINWNRFAKCQSIFNKFIVWKWMQIFDKKKVLLFFRQHPFFYKLFSCNVFFSFFRYNSSTTDSSTKSIFICFWRGFGIVGMWSKCSTVFTIEFPLWITILCVAIKSVTAEHDKQAQNNVHIAHSIYTFLQTIAKEFIFGMEKRSHWRNEEYIQKGVIFKIWI